MQGTFRRLAGAFLDDGVTPGELFEAAQQLHAMLSNAVGFTGRELDADLTVETHLPSGDAISPLDAGRCLMDLARTSKFARGLAAAVSCWAIGSRGSRRRS